MALLVLACCIGLIWWIAPERGGRADEAGAPALIVSPIDESALTVLPGNTRREANTANDRGAVAADFPLPHLMLQLRRPPERQRAFDRYVDQLTTPGLPNYHRWLSASEIGERYGLAEADLVTVSEWLKAHGMTVNAIYPSRTVIDFSADAGAIAQAFHTDIHRLEVNGAAHFANMSDPELPAALAPVIAGIASLNDFRPRPLYRPRTNYSEGNGSYAVAPADLATIYNLKPLFAAGLTGTGQTVVVIEDTDVFTTADWNAFRSTFKLNQYKHGSFTQVHPGAAGDPCTAPGVNADDVEAILDAEWASAAAPDATIELASCADTATFGGFIALQNLLNKPNPPPLVSISYGEDEADLGASGNAFINALYEQAAAEGVSIFVAAGDSGAAATDQNATHATHGITVSGFATTP